MARAAVHSAYRRLRTSPRLAVILVLLPFLLVTVLGFCFSDRSNHLLLFESRVTTLWPEPRTVAFVDGDELTIARGHAGGGSFFNADTWRNLKLPEDGPQPLADSWGPRTPQKYGVGVPWLVVADSEILVRHVPTSRRLATEDERARIRQAHAEAMRTWQGRPDWMTDRLLDAGAVGGGTFTSVRPLYLIADLLFIMSIGAAVLAIVCLWQWWWRREWSPEDGKGTVRRHSLWIGVLTAFLVVDVVAVMMLVRLIAPPFCPRTITFLGTVYRNQSYAQAEVIYDGVKTRLVVDTPRSQWPPNWERLSHKINLPRTTNDGLITPYRTTWWTSFLLRLTEEQGGEEAEEALRRELASVLRADPKFGPHMPTWYWDNLSAGGGLKTTYNYWLILHDTLFVGALAVVGWCMLTLAVAGAKWLRGPGPGFCSKCRYDLQGLSSEICPECGTPIERSMR